MEWQTATNPVTYPEALERMAGRVAAIQQGSAPELAWLVEHPPLYTGGTSAQSADLLQADFPVFKTGRGGQYTYHGPGQRVGYLMLDLKKRAQPKHPDLRAYVQNLERWVILTLGTFGVDAFTREGRIGVWVATRHGEAKIAALGVRIQRWVTSHGISLNVNPDLSHYAGIVPCGISEYGVTSLHALGKKVSMDEVDAALKKTFTEVF